MSYNYKVKLQQVFTKQAFNQYFFPQDLFFNKPIGLLALLDEESHFPQVSAG